MKKRADLLLVQQGLVSSRNEAQALLLAGKVFSSKGRVEKPGQLLAESELLEVKEKLPFVSRGGLKLDPVLKQLGVDPAGKICLDVGASTGGFTDCLLQRGAKKVYAIDVGYGQFHERLRKDPRVTLFEKTNFRYFERGKIPEPVDLAVVDVSFISLTKILPKLRDFLKEESEALVLVKPQFELGPKDVKKGVVRLEADRLRAVEAVVAAAVSLGFRELGRAPSPVKGPKGNQECFLYLITPSKCATLKTC